jgi:hypothetical protein
MERRTLLRGALILPAAAATPLALTASRPQPEAKSPRSKRIRTWQVETLDRRVNPR